MEQSHPAGARAPKYLIIAHKIRPRVKFPQYNTVIIAFVTTNNEFSKYMIHNMLFIHFRPQDGLCPVQSFV